MEKNKALENHGKSKCCKAKVEYSGGGYDGEEIIPVVSWCTACFKNNPKIVQSVGRPRKIDF